MFSPHDVVDLPGIGPFEVIGYPEDYTHGPFRFTPELDTPHTVGHHSYSSASADDYGREVESWAPAKDAPGTPVEVYGWANPTGSEPKLAGHDRVTVEVELYIPPGLVVNLRRVEG